MIPYLASVAAARQSYREPKVFMFITGGQSRPRVTRDDSYLSRRGIVMTADEVRTFSS